MFDLTPIFLSLKLAFITSVFLFIVCLYPAFLMARKDFFAKKLIITFISMPLVLPPTVLGFYLLVFFSPNNVFGEFLSKFDIRLVFNFQALVVASVIYSLPFMFNPLYTAFLSLPKNLFDKAKLLEKSTFNLIFRLCIPLMLPSIFSAFAMTFAHTMGEFGVVMMIGGSVSGSTKVASIAVFEAIENIDYSTAYKISGILLCISCAILLPLQYIKNKKY